MWAVISKDMGLEYNDGELMRLMYAMYLDVLVYYYKIKSTKEMTTEKEIREDIGMKRRTRSMEMEACTSMMSHDEPEQAVDEHYALEQAPDEHYAFFAGNDWYGLKRLKQRKKFDFKRAEKAVNEANESVQKNSRNEN
ncbi:hypothetical protein Hanom_Chr03g00194831 [Helianthus anomalus]